MVEAHEDPVTVHLTRTRAHEDALRAQAAQNTAAAATADIGTLVDALDAPVSFPAPAGQALMTETPAPASSALDDATFRQLRLGITAMLVLVLLVAWMWQKRSARA